MGLTRSQVALVLELAGGFGLSVGFALLALWLGIVVAGLLLILFGVALERSNEDSRNV